MNEIDNLLNKCNEENLDDYRDEGLDLLQEMVNKLIATNSSNNKKEILKSYIGGDLVAYSPESWIKDILVYVYNPYWIYNITSKTCIKKTEICNHVCVYNNIMDLLDDLRTRKITGHDAIGAVNAFVTKYSSYRDLIFNIIDKNLKTRTDAKLINKICQGLIPQFNVALAAKYQDHKKKVDFEKDIWLASRKMNGLRGLTRCENGKSNVYSRSGKEFMTLNVLRAALNESIEGNWVLDGEICLMNDNGLEDFQGILSEYNKKNHTIESPKYVIFDILTLEEFDSGISDVILSERLKRFDKIFKKKSDTFELLNQIRINNIDDLELLMDEAEIYGWEGRIIRKDTFYKGKRSNDILKVKRFFDAEYKVIDTENGIQRYINEETGLESEEEMMTRVNIKHKGNIVGVGSGWSLEQRKYYYKHPELIIGKIITVQYKEETQNKQGDYSLQFPTVKAIYDKRDT